MEDQTLMRQGLKTILELEPGMRVIGEAEDGETAIQRVLETRPDVTLIHVPHLLHYLLCLLLHLLQLLHPLHLGLLLLLLILTTLSYRCGR